jgi:hypothetical protein
VSEEEPRTPLQEAAAQAHEMFITFMAQGFTEQQALYLVGQLLVNLKS